MSKKTSKSLQVSVPTPTTLSAEKATAIELQFKPMLDEMNNLAIEFNEIIAKPKNKATAKEARTLRLKYVKTRTSTAKIHKPIKAVVLAAAKFIDGFKSSQVIVSSANEAVLKAIEDYKQLQSEAAVDKIRRNREFSLAEFDVMAFPSNLGEWPDEVWDTYLTGVKAKYKSDKEDKLQARLQAEKDAAIKAEADKAKSDELSDLKAKVAEAAASPVVVTTSAPTIGLDETVSDVKKAEAFARDLKVLRYKYTFTGETYKWAFTKACERFENMEDYFTRTLNI